MAGTELYEFDATLQAPVYLGRNALGDVTWTTQANAAVISTANYDPFRNLVNSCGSVPNTRWQSSRPPTYGPPPRSYPTNRLSLTFSQISIGEFVGCS
jgi:hypothetical protein